MRRLALLGSLVAALAAATAAPAPAFHHTLLPANECGQSSNAGGFNPTAVGEVRDHAQANGGNLPLPPAGTAAVDASPIIGPGVECPAPQK